MKLRANEGCRIECYDEFVLMFPMTSMQLRRVASSTVLFCLAVAVAVAKPVELRTSAAASVLVCGGSMMNGNHFADMVLPVMREHYRGCTKVALVLHASHPTERDKMEKRMQEAFDHLAGIAVESLHRHDAAGQRALLESADGIFVGGGETFVLLGELHRSGQLELIRQRVLSGVPYGGTSAGANVGGLLIGTTNDFPVADIPTRDALALFPATINPHHPLPETKTDFDGRAAKIKIYLSFNPDETVLALANASVARLHQGIVSFEAGSGWLYRHDSTRPLVAGDRVPELTTVASK